MKNIRQYNFLFAFMLMGAHIDDSVNDGLGPPVFKIRGQVHHPKFIQLYIYDTSNEVNNRLKCLSSSDTPNGSLQPSIVDALMKMLDRCNPLVKKFRIAREQLADYPEEDL